VPTAPSSSGFSVGAATRQLVLGALPRYVVAGDVFVFMGIYVQDSAGIPGAMIKIRYCLYDKPSICYDIGTTTTASDGSFKYSWSVPYGMACRKYLFYAVDEQYDVVSEMREMAIAYETRIRITDKPSYVAPGAPFTVKGVLEKRVDPTTWSPVPGESIDVYVDGARATTVVTDSSGAFSATITITTPGSHTIEFRYAGTV
jgi:hypothetical protein